MTDHTGNSSTAADAANHSQLKPSSSSNKGPSSKETDSKHSSIAPLAPLEYLQNQRRGSITDPSLHAATHNSTPKQNMQTFRQPEPTASTLSGTSSAPQESNMKTNSSDPRPSSPYVFGDATSNATDNAHIRRLLRSPSTEHDSTRSSSALARDETPGSHELTSRNISGYPEHPGVQGVSCYQSKYSYRLHSFDHRSCKVQRDGSDGCGQAKA
jgi:hypothetical protein